MESYDESPKSFEAVRPAKPTAAKITFSLLFGPPGCIHRGGAARRKSQPARAPPPSLLWWTYPSTPRWVQALQNSLCKSLKSADCRKRVLDNLSSYLWLILTLSSASVLCNVSATLRARVSLPAVGGALAA